MLSDEKPVNPNLRHHPVPTFTATAKTPVQVKYADQLRASMANSSTSCISYLQDFFRCTQIDQQLCG